MDKEKMKNNLSEIELNEARNSLFGSWIDENLGPLMGPEKNNLEQIKLRLIECKEKGVVLPLIGIGCQPLSEISLKTGETIFLPKDIDVTVGSRILRWSERFLSLQRALLDFGVKTHLSTTLSDVQVRAQLIDKNMSVTDTKAIVNGMDMNNDRFAKVLENHGCQFDMFVHSDLMREAIKGNSFIDVIKFLLPNWNGEQLVDFGSEELDPIVFELLCKDVSFTPRTLFGDDPFLIIDMMLGTSQDREWLNQAFVGKAEKALGILDLSVNGGNWNAAPEPFEIFDSIQKFVSKKLGLDFVKIQSNDKFIQRINNTAQDMDIENLLSSLRINFKISNLRDRTVSLQLLEKVLFNTQKFKSTKEIEINAGERILNILKSTLSLHRSQVIAQIDNKDILVDGIPIEDINFVPISGQSITIGKKVVISMK